MVVNKLKQVIHEKKTKITNFKLDKAENTELRILVMVILSGLSNFILRIFGVFSVITVFYNLNKDIQRIYQLVCYGVVCTMLKNVSNCFFLISLLNNFFFYYKFNKKFREAVLRTFKSKHFEEYELREKY